MPNHRWIVSCIVPLSLITACSVPGSGGGEDPAPTRQAWFELVEGTPFAADAASTGGVSWVDFDGDGDLDLYVTNGYDVSSEEPQPQRNRLYENRGGELFEVASGPLAEDDGFSSGSTWGDFDNDGWLDVFVSNQRDQNNFLYRGGEGGVFTRIEGSPPTLDGGQSYAASWVDIDRDGFIDLYVANGGMSHTGRNFLYRNMGDGSFQPINEGALVSEEGASGGVSWADYDGDGDQDVFVCDLSQERTGTGGLFRNDGDWAFTRLGPEQVPLGGLMPTAAAWGDCDNDGDLDVYLAAAYGLANVLLRNDGNGGFERVDEGDAVLDGGHSYAASWADADNDGDLDLAVGNWGSAPLLYENDGSGVLDRADAGDLGTTVEHPGTLAWGDLDGDGSLDLALGNWPNVRGPGELNHLFRNTRHDGHWLIVDLEGTASNRAAIGARVLVTTTIDGTTTTQIREVSAHSGFRSQNDLRSHFGLGDADGIESLVVQWPSGAATRLVDLEADQIVHLREGD